MATEKRLIDANKFEKLVLNHRADYLFKEDVIAALAKQPTVDAVEVVHGRWVHVPSSDMMTGKAYKCSKCNKMRHGSFMPNYCQNCGAKMDK